jgi:hypothetical protein
MTNIKGKSLATTGDRTPDYPVCSLVVIPAELPRLNSKVNELNFVPKAVIVAEKHLGRRKQRKCL